ncbi:type II toxin-antitoxin system VapC family toxin [Nocardioides sp. GXZ039]|uniref:type II toxin-antitoxin system VapC family toxin n=1 Tax=Nocardioides sp. GXZ039 TaxID=3136018 RepID=UPI0030F48F76
MSVHAPSLLGVEVTAALRGLALGGHATPERAELALRDLDAAAIARHDPTPLLPRVWELRADLTPYDAAYVALADPPDHARARPRA